jgi:transposase
MEKLGYKPDFIYLDSTSFHLHGDKYNEEPVRVSITGKTEANKKEPVKMVQGYSRAAHTELPQVMMQMIVENQAGISLFMKPQNGNINDSDGFAKSLNEVESLLKSLKNGVKSPYLVCDAALYTAENLKDIYVTRENRIKFITRAPSKIKEVEGKIKQANAEGFEPIREQYSGRMYDFSYADVPQKFW